MALIPHQSSAEFSPCGDHRVRLDRWWSDEPRALVGMCNPSIAGDEKQDPTIHRLFDLLVDRPGIGGFTVVNYETRVATDVTEMRAWRLRLMHNDPDAHDRLRDENLARIRALSADAAVRIVAWGNLVEPDRQATLILRALSLDGMHDLFAFGTTNDGRPKHPMARGKHRLVNGQPLVLWRPAIQQSETAHVKR